MLPSDIHSPSHSALVEAKRKQGLLIRFAAGVLIFQGVVVSSSIVGLALQDPSVKALTGQVAKTGEAEAGAANAEKPAPPASTASEEELAARAEGHGEKKEGHGEKKEGHGEKKEGADEKTAANTRKTPAELFDGMGQTTLLNPIEAVFLEEKELKTFKRLGYK